MPSMIDTFAIRQAEQALTSLAPERVRSVYEGRADRCACGCSGTYYGPEYLDAPEAVNTAKVVAILKRVQKRAVKADRGEVESLWTCTYKDGSRMWAYQTKTQLIRVESKAANES